MISLGTERDTKADSRAEKIPCAAGIEDILQIKVTHEYPVSIHTVQRITIFKKPEQKHRCDLMNGCSTIAFRPKRGQSISDPWKAGDFIEGRGLYGVDKGFPV
jgi:hypothetical protein